MHAGRGQVAHHDSTHPCRCQPLHRLCRRTVRMPIHLMRRAIGCNQVQSGAIRPPDGADAHPHQVRGVHDGCNQWSSVLISAHPHQVRGVHDGWRFRQVGLRGHAIGEQPPTCGKETGRRREHLHAQPCGKCHQWPPMWPSVAISGHRWSSAVISCHSLPSSVISGHPRGHQKSSEVISSHQRSSVVIRGHQWSSVVISPPGRSKNPKPVRS